MVCPTNGDQNDFDITSAWDALDVPNKKKTGQRMTEREKSERQPIKKNGRTASTAHGAFNANELKSKTAGAG